jgi:hypothetical protein
MVYKFPATPENSVDSSEFFFGKDAPRCSTCRTSIRYYGMRSIKATKQCGECYAKNHKPYRLVEKGNQANARGCWTMHLVQPLVPGKHIRLHNVAYWELHFPDPHPQRHAEYRPLVSFTDFSQVKWLHIPVDDGKSLPFSFVGKVDRGLYHENGNDEQILFERKGEVFVFRAGY